MTRLCLTAVLCSLVGASAAPRLPAQAPAPSLLSGTATGVSLDRFEAEGEGITTLSLRVTTLKPHTIGTDFALSVWPEGVAYGALAMGIDVGPAYNLAAPHSTLLIKAGLSAAMAAAGGWAGAAAGAYVGAGLVGRLAPRLGVRMDAALHGYTALGAEGAVLPVLSMSIGLTSLPAPH